MSYDKNINDCTVKFKDEISYLEAKLENLKLYSDIPFIGFLQNEMYNKSTCTVESIEPVQYTGGISDFQISDNPTELFSGNDFHNNTFTTTNAPIGFALEDGCQSNVIPVNTISFNPYSADTGDVHISGNLIVDGSITWDDGSQTLTTHEPAPLIEIPKEKEPEDPIDNRFDILDL